MTKRGRSRVFLGVQWDSGSWENLPPLCELLVDRAGKRPIVWNFPSLVHASPRKNLTWLEKAIGGRLGLDLIACMGFAGACHPVLTLDELDKELAWGIENPWDTGVSQVFDARPDVLMPRVPDLGRPAALKLYVDHGFTTLGIPNGREFAWFAGADLECFTYCRIRAADWVRPGPGARPGTPALPRGDVLLILDLSGRVTPQDLAAAFDRGLAPLLAPEDAPSPLAAARSTFRDLGHLAADSLDWSGFPDPALRQAVAEHAGKARKKRKKNDEYRDLLARLSLAAEPQEAQPPQKEPLRTGPQLVAQMLGDVALTGNGFDVRLSGGRFTGISRAGRECLPVRPARSYLRVGKRTLHFRTVNSFSFEGDGVVGLREVLGIDSLEGAALSIEYSFCEGCSMLEITADVRWPTLAPGTIVEEHAPLVLYLREMGRAERAVVECVALDGTVSSPPVGEGRWVMIPGALYRVALDKEITLLLRPGPPGIAAAWSLTSFRVAREGRRRYLEANPFGGWSALKAAALSGRRERLSLLVGLEDRQA